MDAEYGVDQRMRSWNGNRKYCKTTRSCNIHELVREGVVMLRGVVVLTSQQEGVVMLRGAVVLTSQ